MRLFRSTTLATRVMVVAIASVLWSVLAITPAHAAPGDLDTTFGPDQGSLAMAMGGYISDSVIASDGGLIAVGNLNSQATVFKFRADGSRDLTFNSSGTPGHLSMTGWNWSVFTAIDFQSDGKIVAVGNNDVSGPGGDLQAMVVRVNATGTLDTTFANLGVFEVPNLQVPVNEGFLDIDIDSAGVIYAAGFRDNTPNDDGLLVSLTTAGAFSPGFNSGAPLIDQYKVFNTVSVTAQNDVVVGGVIVTNPSNSILFQRLSPAGIVDSQFGLNGLAWFSLPGEAVVMDAYVDEDGIAFVGEFFDGTLFRGLYGRLDLTGALDLNFLTNSPTPGVLLMTNYGTITQIIRQADGKYIFTGTSSTSLTTRVLSNGEIDTSFSPSAAQPGTFQFSSPGYNNLYSASVNQAADGSLFVTGNDFTNNPSFAMVYKLLGNPVPAPPAPTLASTGFPSSAGMLVIFACVTLFSGVIVLRTKRFRMTDRHKR